MELNYKDIDMKKAPQVHVTPLYVVGNVLARILAFTSRMDIHVDDEVKKLIDDSPTLKKKLYDKDGNFKSEELDKISDNIIRVETNYLGSKKKKKGFFAKLKDWWNGNSDDEKEEQVDPKELEQFALKLASKRIKLKKQKVEEGLEEFEDFTILEANMEIFEREFANYFNNEELLNESSEEEQEMLLY